MICTRVLNRDPGGVRSPADLLHLAGETSTDHADLDMVGEGERGGR